MTVPMMPTPDDLSVGDSMLPSADAADANASAAIQQRTAGMEALYGSEFPLLKDAPEKTDWVNWARGLWNRHRAGVQKRLHLTERNRLFRANIQWISSTGLGPWREPPKPKEQARVVVNMIDKALDQRLQIITEQRPGFQTQPVNTDPDSQKKAEAQQRSLEYQWDEQKMELVNREAAYWAQTDGVSFLCAYWDPDAGPWAEIAQESWTPEQNLQPGAAEAPAALPAPPSPDMAAPAMPGAPPAAPMPSALSAPVQSGPPPQQAPQAPSGMPSKFPLGDVRTCVYRIEQVRVSANASAHRKPDYWVVREIIPKADAVARYGSAVATANDASGATGFINNDQRMTRSGLDLPGEYDLHAEQDVVERFTVFCGKSEYLDSGLVMVCVGEEVVYEPRPLPPGIVPMVRVTDGSTDPAFYCRPIMDGWIDSQMRINALVSKWVDSVRLNAGGRIIGRPGALSTETLVSNVLSFVEYRGGGNPNQDLMPMQGFSVGQDVKDLLEFEIKQFENASGWNDTSRGSFSSDESGRAILAQRETLERVFAPPVGSLARAMSEWGEIVLHWMRWGYSAPRTIALMGQSRSDLAETVSSETFDGISQVQVDPETLMPMPRSLKLFLLDQMAADGTITPQEKRRRMPFAFVGNIDSPDIDQTNRAQRIAQAIKKSGNPNALDMRWTDNEALHQDVLEREILLRDDLSPQIIQAGMQRWTMLAQQAQSKQAASQPQAPQVHPHGHAPQQDPRRKPLAGSNPSVSAAPLLLSAGDQQQAAQLSTATQPA